MNEKVLESQLLEIMAKNPRKFTEIMEKSSMAFKEKFNREMQFKNKEQIQIIDGSVVQDYFTSLEMLEQWMQKCIDEIRMYIQPISYPLFVYLYLELILKNYWDEAHKFLNKYMGRFPAFKKEIEDLELLKSPLNVNMPLVSNYLKNKIHIFIPKTTFNFLIHFLNTNHLILILHIINKYFETSNILSKLDNQNDNNRFLLLNHSGEEIEKINSRTQIYYNKINKEQIDTANKGKGRSKGEKNLLSKVIIPFPEQLNEFVAMDPPLIKINKKNPPTIGCFTVLNTNNKLNCADMTSEGGIIACGYKDGSIMVWVLDKDINIEITEENLKALEEYKDADLETFIKNQDKTNSIKDPNQMDIDTKPNDTTNVNPDTNNNISANPQFVYELITQRHRKITLYGHTDAIYSISISPDKENIVSGSFDGTIRLWNLHTKTTIAVYRGHFSPVLSVKFAPVSHYFASGGCDRTARLWAINSAGPLRIFAGHLSDVELVDFHPNSLYLITSANDKTIRLWTIKTGECVRIFVNYSNCGYIDCLCFSNSGKLLAVGVDRGIIVYDLVKMGDPVSIVSNLTNKSITSMSFDNDDNVITACTEDYKVCFYDVESILNSEDNLMIDNEKEKKVDLIYSYMTKKTTVLSTKFTNTNVMLILGRFDDNDPKIFM